jgi:hypothetical protein
MSGLKDMSKSYSRDLYTEHVALVTFGHQTKIQVGYTADYRDIEKELGIVAYCYLNFPVI